MKGLGIFYKKSDIFKTYLKTFRPHFRKIAFLLTTYSFVSVELYFVYHVKVIDILCKKIVIIPKKLKVESFRTKFRNNLFCLFLIHY